MNGEITSDGSNMNSSEPSHTEVEIRMRNGQCVKLISSSALFDVIPVCPLPRRYITLSINGVVAALAIILVKGET